MKKLYRFVIYNLDIFRIIHSILLYKLNIVSKKQCCERQDGLSVEGLDGFTHETHYEAYYWLVNVLQIDNPMVS